MEELQQVQLVAHLLILIHGVNAATTAAITDLTAGTYSVTVSDRFGCLSNSSAIITPSTGISASVVVDNNISCPTAADGVMTASATNGTAPYTYFWSIGATTATITGLSADPYTVTIFDDNGCFDTASGTITMPSGLIAAIVINSNISCNGTSDGVITTSAIGGTNPYTYLWSNGATTTASITGLPAATYTVTITDDNGCTDTDNKIISEPSVLIASTAINHNVSCNGNSDGEMENYC